MRKLFVLLAVLFVAAVPALAQNVVVNGGFETGDLTGWTKWTGGWGSGYDTVTQNGAVTTADGTWRGRLQINNGQGSFGIYQVVPVTANLAYNFSAWVRSTVATGTASWAEVMVYNYAIPGGGDIDSGTTSKPFCVWKRDAWTGYAGVPGGSLPTVSTPGGPGDNWEKIVSQVTSPTGFVTIAYKWGRSGAGFSGSLYVDANSLSAVPEPSSLIALLSGLAGIAGVVVKRR